MPAWSEAHDAAVRHGQPRYIDPTTGYQVFTEATLRSRGRCCGSGCRHCPFGHVRVRRGPRQTRGDGQPTWRLVHEQAPAEVDVLFWSGGKDAYLAWLSLQEEAARPTVLLTTHDPAAPGAHDWVPHQEVPLSAIQAQARALDAELITVPAASDYPGAVRAALSVVAARSRVRRVVFGDLHLVPVRSWREQSLAPWLEAHGAELAFPLWEQPTATLLGRLQASEAQVVVSAARPGIGLAPGDRFDPSRLVAGIDPMGENGEYHTLVTPPPGGTHRL